MIDIDIDQDRGMCCWHIGLDSVTYEPFQVRLLSLHAAWIMPRPAGQTQSCERMYEGVVPRQQQQLQPQAFLIGARLLMRLTLVLPCPFNGEQQTGRDSITVSKDSPSSSSKTQ